jgi:hypothetical protein
MCFSWNLSRAWKWKANSFSNILPLIFRTPMGFFAPTVPSKSIVHFPISPTCAPWAVQLIILDDITQLDVYVMFVNNTNCAVSLHKKFSKSPLTSSFVDLDIFVFFLQVSAPKPYMYLAVYVPLPICTPPYMYPSLYVPLRFPTCPVNASTLIWSPF